MIWLPYVMLRYLEEYYSDIGLYLNIIKKYQLLVKVNQNIAVTEMVRNVDVSADWL